MKLPMKLLRTAGLCLAAMFVMSMVAAGTASAAPPVWEQCATEKASEAKSKYTEHQCETASATGGWAWQEVKGTEKVISHGSLVLRDTETILAKPVAVSCSGKNSGTIGPKQFDRIETITEIQCSNVENCEAGHAIEAEAVNLPWQTELFETEGKVRDNITNGKMGESAPGWNVKCTVSGVSATDKCTAAEGNAGIANQATKVGTVTELLVLATFDGKSPNATCTLGKKEKTGEVRGNIAILKENGWGLRVS